MSVLKIWFIDFQPVLKIIFIGKIWVLPMMVKQQRGMKSSTRPQHSALSLIKVWNMFIYMYNWQLIIIELKCKFFFSFMLYIFVYFCLIQLSKLILFLKLFFVISKINIILGYVGFQGTMSFKRFEKLSWYFHLNDNQTQGLRGTLKIEVEIFFLY